MTRISKHKWKDKEQEIRSGFLFSAQFIFKYWPGVENCWIKYFFPIRKLMKNNADLNAKKQRWSCLHYVFRFMLICESYLYYKTSPTSILFSRVRNNWFLFRKKNENHEKKIQNLQQKFVSYSNFTYYVQISEILYAKWKK